MLFFLSCVHAFYLPGLVPQTYQKGAEVPLYVNSLESPETVLPYDYYDKRFGFCAPEKIEDAIHESLGSVLAGDRIHRSVFKLKMLETQTCQKLCDPKLTSEQTDFLRDQINLDYYVHWEIDQFPVGHDEQDKKQHHYWATGFPLGHSDEKNSKTPGTIIVYNHFDLKIQYNQDEKGYYVVGASISPRSIKHLDGNVNCDSSEPQTLVQHETPHITYSYSVVYEKSDSTWATRWDKYLDIKMPNIHWFNLINSFVITLFLSGMVAMILLRALHKDIARYNKLDDQEDAQEDFGWKLIHGDVFRAPAHSQLLCVLLGNGAQVACMTIVTLIFGAFGFLSPSSRGQMLTSIVVLYVCFGFVAGYVSARFYKMFGGENWKRNVALASFLVPGIIFGIFIFLNFFLIGAKSSSAVPFTTLIGLMALWFLVSVPLCFLGAYYGFKQPRIEQPVRTNQIPRQLPEVPYYAKPIPAILLGGILPFGAIFIELFFIFKSIWAHQVYYAVGFLLFVVLVLLITCAEVTILMCYFHISHEDYRWWWRAFFTSGASAFYLFLYSIFYYAKTQIKGTPSFFLYFGWSFIMALLFFLLTGN